MKENLGSEITSRSDYSYVETSARIALYDDLLSAPRIIDVEPNTTREFIANLSSTVYEQARQLGGGIPYTIIEQVSENFIHASFNEMVVSIFDQGNTIRFTDQGPGILDKEKVQQPGYSSATKEMKNYINGVGSGLPIVREYLDTKHGTIHIEDNLNCGAVVTISLTGNGSENSAVQYVDNIKDFIPEKSSYIPTLQNRSSNAAFPIPSLSKRALSIINLFKDEDIWGVKDISQITNIPMGSTHNELSKLEEMGIIIHVGTKRSLTEYGKQLLKAL